MRRVRTFFQREMSPPPEASEAPESRPVRERLHLAACALLLELVYADDEFSDAERAHMEGALGRHFGLDEGTARELIDLAEAERAAAVDLYQFTSLIRSRYDLGQKTVLAEIMWGLVLADGDLAQHEAYILRRIANLLDLKPGFLAEARKRARSRTELDGS